METPGAIDDPDLDATDWAHPAWWRGQRHGVETAIRSIEAVIVHGLVGSCADPKLQALRKKIDGLVRQSECSPSRWIKETPTVPGWYYWCSPRGKPCVVRTWKVENVPHLFSNWYGGAFVDDPFFSDGYWYGPIDVPQPPELPPT